MWWDYLVRSWKNLLVPSCFLLFEFFFEAFSRVSLSKAFYPIWNPFNNFISLQDIPGPAQRTDGCSLLKLRILALLSACLSARWAGHFAFHVLIHDKLGVSSSFLFAFSWGYIAVKCIMKQRRTPPYLFLFFASSELLLEASNFFHLPSPSLDMWSVQELLSIVILGCFIWVGGSLPLKEYKPAENVAKPGDLPSNTLSNPEDDVTLWSWSTFSFLGPIFKVASIRTVNESDVWNLSPFFQHKIIFSKLLDYRSLYPNHSLLRFLLVSNSLDLILDVVLEMWSAIIGFVPPYALQEILRDLADDSQESRQKTLFWTFMTFIAHLSFAQVDLYQGWHTRRCYERTRGQLFCMLHYKTLKRKDISGTTNHSNDREPDNADLGKIVNLMQGDAYNVAQRFWEFSGFVTAPVRLVIALIFLYQVLGWSASAAVAVVVFVYLLNYPLAKLSVRITRSSWRARDKRMSLVNELLQNIRFLKFYGWESQWTERTMKARETELSWRVKQNFLSTGISFLWTWLPSATALIAFLCYTIIAGESLTVSKAFTAIALFSYLQGPMIALPGQFFAFLQAYVSMQRIEAFLNEEEVPAWASTLAASVSAVTQDKIGFSQATFWWETTNILDSTESRFQLGPLNITFPRDKLTLVTGVTGSGKSALLAALLGEMNCKSGDVFLDKTRHKVSYCGQNPWLEHATIRDNIIYGSSYGYVKERYEKILEACALNRDLEVFDAGDMTEIGEKGVTLSGGQRARVALARALYSEAQCILLDDPLAAVDMHTAQHLVSNCLVGDLAQGRTIILVTHHVSLCLPVASYYIQIDQGMVIRQGPGQEFLNDRLHQNVFAAEISSLIEDTVDEVITNEADVIADSDIRSSNQLTKSHSRGKLIEDEARAEGQLSWQTYYTYIRATGFLSWTFTLILIVLIKVINVGNQVYLAKWGEAYENSTRSQSIDYPWSELPLPSENVRPWLLVYLYLSAAGATTVLLYIGLGYYASLQAARSLFNSLLRRLSRAPVRFYDVTPIGRILNRFTTDIDTIDAVLQNSSRACLSGVLNFLASFLVILWVVPVFIPFALFIAWLYVRLAPPYIRASRDLRRLELVSLSPAFAGFDELLRGIVTVRAFGMEQYYQDRFYTKVDKFQSFDHVYWQVAGWLRWRYDCLGSLVVFASTMFALWSGVSNGFAAIVIVQAGNFADASRDLVSVAAQLELNFNSVERVIEYLDVVQEAPAIIEKNRPPAYWPSSSGGLEVEDLTIHYAPHLPPALRGISFSVKPSEKIGVVGRTGSGKSTLALSLLRMIEPSKGVIMLDNIDITKLGLEDLRTRITIISQDVSLFSGTIRSNLDPLGLHTTEECLDVAERCHLPLVIKHLKTDKEPTILDMPVNQDSLSAGEKQLVALARAILRRTNVIILDEATSQIDIQLDDQIQQTVREELSGAIVITIAHRLKTIMDYDRIMVLDDGQIAEFDTPRALLWKEGGAFNVMCRKSADWPSFARMTEDFK